MASFEEEIVYAQLEEVVLEDAVLLGDLEFDFGFAVGAQIVLLFQVCFVEVELQLVGFLL